jgi:hypothetical protein
MNIDFLKSSPPSKIHQRTISGNSADSGKPEGLDLLYNMNPHLDPGNFKSPTDPARFNTSVWGNPAGRTIAPPAEGTVMRGGQAVPMTGTEIFDQMSQVQQQPSAMRTAPNALSGPYGQGSVGQGQQGQTGALMNNGVQTPMNLFLQGADQVTRQGMPSSNYQMGLTPEQIQQLLASPLFGMPGGRSAPQRQIY